jgi:DNA-3-methyladenine glycosylase II
MLSQTKSRVQSGVRLFRTTNLATPREFSFEECLKFLARSDKERTHTAFPDRVRKLIKSDAQPILFDVRNGRPGFVQITFINQPVDAATRSMAVKYVREWFDLVTDISPFYRFAKRQALLRQLTTNHRGLRLIKIPDLFEALCWAIIGQQINVAFAYTLKQRLVENYGEAFTHNGRAHWLFPTPEVIAKLQLTDLLTLQFTRQKSNNIIGLARLMRDGCVSKESLLALTNADAARDALLKIRGIGPWTASYVMMRCLGLPSAIPIEDIGLHNAIKRQLNLASKPTLDEVRKLAAGWGEWPAYVAFYLYRSLL